MTPEYYLMLLTVVIGNGVTIAVLKTDIAWIKGTINRHQSMLDAMNKK